MLYKVYLTDTFTNQKHYYLGKKSKGLQDFTGTSMDTGKTLNYKQAFAIVSKGPEYTAVCVSK